MGFTAVTFTVTSAAGADASATCTLWAVFQFSVVKVSRDGVKSTPSWWRPTVTFAFGAADSAMVADCAVLQFSVVKVSDAVCVAAMAGRSVQPSLTVAEGAATAAVYGGCTDSWPRTRRLRPRTWSRYVSPLVRLGMT